MSKRKIYASITMLAAMLAYGGTSHADEQFTARSLRGTFGFSGAGTLLGFPAAVVGLTKFDGAGSCVITAHLNLGGTVQPLSSTSCSYTVNHDGSGSQDITFAGPFGPFRSDLVIVSGNKEIQFILSDGFGGKTVASGVSKRQGGGD